MHIKSADTDTQLSGGIWPIGQIALKVNTESRNVKWTEKKNRTLFFSFTLSFVFNIISHSLTFLAKRRKSIGRAHVNVSLQNIIHFLFSNIGCLLNEFAITSRFRFYQFYAKTLCVCVCVFASRIKATKNVNHLNKHSDWNK